MPDPIPSARVESSKDLLARKAALAVLVASFGVLAVTASVGLMPAVRTFMGWPSAKPPTAYAVGGRIDLSADYFDHAPHTLVVFASGTCGPCLRSADTLAGLADRLRGSTTQFLLLSPDSMRVDQASLASRIRLTSTEFRQLDISTLRVKSVPMVVLVDRHGTVLYVHEGAIGLSEQQEILDSIPGGIAPV